MGPRKPFLRNKRFVYDIIIVVTQEIPKKFKRDSLYTMGGC